jgi:hypothetical protein
MDTAMMTKPAFSALVLAAAVSLGACSTESPVAPGRSANAPSLARSGAQTTVGNLIAALNNVAVNIDELNALNNLTIQDVQVVNVENVLNNARVLENARFLNNITVLQDFLNNSLNDLTLQVLNDALNNNNVVITDVIAIDVLSGGDVIVFTR